MKLSALTSSIEDNPALNRKKINSHGVVKSFTLQDHLLACRRLNVQRAAHYSELDGEASIFTVQAFSGRGCAVKIRARERREFLGILLSQVDGGVATVQ